MNQRQYEITRIPSNLKALSNFTNWICVGQLIEEAMLVGLIEYHIKVNQVQIIQSQILGSNQQNQAMQKINTLLNNSKNKPNRFKSFIEEVKIQDPYGQWFKDVIKSYFRYNFKTCPSDQFKFLSDTFKVQFIVIEQPNSNSQQLYGIETYGGINKIILYKYQEKYYLILTQIEKKCHLCKNKINLIDLKCQHQMCYNCIQKQFEQSKSVQYIKCNLLGCTEYIYKSFYLNLQKEYQQNLCIQCHQIVPINHQTCQSCKEQNEKQLQETYIEQKQSNAEQVEQQQNQTQQNQIDQEQDKKQDITQSSIQNKNNNVQMEIEYDTQNAIQKCAHCKKGFEQNQVIQTPCQHYYCKECALKQCEFRNQFICLQCGYYIQVDYVKLALVMLQMQRKLINESLLFQNQCFHYICASCLEDLASKQTYLRCPNLKCGKGIIINDADLYLDRILTLKIQQTEQESQVNQIESKKEQNQQIGQQQHQQSNIQAQMVQNDKNESSQKKIQNQNNLERSLIQLDEPQNCTFCGSSFTEFNTRQFLSQCQDSRHFIGVCCLIFPLDCPQCQFKSLKIEKGILLTTSKQL
ncbi:unnamed protein product (macronuclear) [Paramecium tetraurelia]|uniref:RING-type domain-containing protein n=1 Tax=Paramecium tetraurelia TaxID=5888 RepID=A0BZ69_PARTE|nr:uncharacterized protein GSPATT00033689001 [Paramecium tetraurelia]CAK63836.1 unnamed protein product [Paramecium tetraurelia]|eukprot:XP_001431234.1 hypothetical protein (macronuclear) [Paramecium tetraurelia strain d4-2]